MIIDKTVNIISNKSKTYDDEPNKENKYIRHVKIYKLYKRIF
jgi:hypothetical protein